MSYKILLTECMMKECVWNSRLRGYDICTKSDDDVNYQPSCGSYIHCSFTKFAANIGKQVTKCRANGEERKTNRKPFKSGQMINTVKGVIEHPQLRVPAYTFIEDESYVECRRCMVVE